MNYVWDKVGARSRSTKRQASLEINSPSLHSSSPAMTSRGDARHPRRPLGQAVIRLIDFAHCTTGDDFDHLDTPAVTPEGEDPRPKARFPPTHPDLPDTGFLLGLRSLCAALERIWNQERERRRHDPDDEVVQLPKLRISGRDVFDRILPNRIIEEATDNGYLGSFDLEEDRTVPSSPVQS